MTSSSTNNEICLKKRKTKVDERDRLQICYICQSSLRWPLQICETGHFACAPCLREQTKASGNWTVSCDFRKKAIEFVFNPNNFYCGLCKLPANVHYAGLVISQLLESSPSSTCPTCKESFPMSKISLHVLSCEYDILPCHYCDVPVQMRWMGDHIRQNCCRTRCSEKHCGFIGTYVTMKKHIGFHDRIHLLTTMMLTMIQSIKDNLVKLCQNSNDLMISRKLDQFDSVQSDLFTLVQQTRDLLQTCTQS